MIKNKKVHHRRSKLFLMKIEYIEFDYNIISYILAP